ncbi:TPA: hypothetical protein ACU1WT_002397 [Staphylococcus aureus]
MSGVINYQFRLNGVLIFKIELLIYYYVWYTNQCFMLYKVILAVVDCSPQHRGFGMSASISCKLAELQHSGIGTSISTNNVSWGNGPQTQKLAESQLKITCKLARPQNSEIGFLISTNSAIWGNGPQTQKLAESQLTITCKLVGPQHRKIGSSISTNNVSWGNSPNTETGRKSA